MLARFLLVALAGELLLYAVGGHRLVTAHGWTVASAVGAASAIFFGWRLGIVITSFAVARLAARAPVSGPLALLRMILVETMVLAASYGVVQILDPWFPRRAGPSASRGADGGRGEAPVVVLVHGYACNGAVWAWFAARLRRHGYDVRVVTLEPVLADIDAQADALARFLDSEVGTGTAPAPPVTLVAHSMGGLVCRAYVRRYGAARVLGLVTLGTPHRGTVHAILGPGRVARQMEPGSAWLTALWDDRHSLDAIEGGVVTLYSVDDNLVAPAETAILPGADVIRLAGQSHTAMPSSPRVLREVLRVLPPARA